MEWLLRHVTTHAKPHAQQQLARYLEVDYENFLAFLVNCTSTKFHTSFECYNQRGYIRTWYVRSEVFKHRPRDCLAAPHRTFEADSAAPWQRALPLDHVQVAAVRAAWHES